MGEPKIVVVDYHKGNLSSVVRGLARAGAAACTSDDPEQIRNADGLVIPGVGAFYDAIAFMSQSGEEAAVLDAVAAGTPLLGICLGLQLFFERGNEGVPADEGAVADGNTPEQVGGPWVDGLGIMRGSCTRLESSRLKVPHVGWDQVHMTPAGAADPLLAGFAEGANMYFTPQLRGGRRCRYCRCSGAHALHAELPVHRAPWQRVGLSVPSREILCAWSAHP